MSKNHLLRQFNQRHQSGAVLIISLIMLLLMTIIGISSTQSTGLEEKMAGNTRDKNLAFQAAESALKVAEARINQSPPPAGETTPPTFDGTKGYYAIAAVPAVTTDAFWATNANSHDAGIDIQGISSRPRYIIQDMGPATSVTCPAVCSRRNYRITVRATGGTSNAVVILESIYEL